MHPLIPLLIVVIILLAAAAVGFVIYGVATDIASKTSKKMEESNINFGKDGVKIGLREMKQEDYVSRTQNVLVQAWNLSTWPAYKSRFWNRQQPGAAGSSSSSSASASGSKRPGMSPRTMSGSSHRSGSDKVSSSHHSTSHRTENGRLAEPRPAFRRTASGSSIPGSFD